MLLPLLCVITAGSLTLTGTASARSSRAHTASPIAIDPQACAGANLIPDAGNLAQARTATLCLVNQERMLHDERALRTNRALTSAASRHNQEMVTRDYFGHIGMRGDAPSSRILGAGYMTGGRSSCMVGENIAWGTLTESTPAAIVETWIESPPHLENILNGRFRDSGIAITPAVPGTSEQGATYTQDFGVILR